MNDSIDKKENKAKSPKKSSSAEEVAEAMAANLAANRNNPDWENDRERMYDKVRKKVIEERKKREAERDKAE